MTDRSRSCDEAEVVCFEELRRYFDHHLVPIPDWRAEIFELHYPKLVRFGYRLTNRWAEAEDLVMDCFVWLCGPDGRELMPEKSAAFLRTAVKFRWRNSFRSGWVKHELVVNELAWDYFSVPNSTENAALALQTLREALSLATENEKRHIRIALRNPERMSKATKMALHSFRRKVGAVPTIETVRAEMADLKRRFLQAIETGATTRQAVRSLGIEKTRPYGWAKTDPVFAMEWQQVVDEMRVAS